MSEAELQRNPVLTDYTVRDLNKDPKLPYDDNTFDVITNVVSVDYLNRPLVSQHISFGLHFILQSLGHCFCLFSLDRLVARHSEIVKEQVAHALVRNWAAPAMYSLPAFG